jgi:hypothetical protein
VQRAAHAALDGRGSFADALAAEPEVRTRLSRAQIAGVLDPARHLTHLGLLFRRGLGSSRATRHRAMAGGTRKVVAARRGAK